MNIAALQRDLDAKKAEGSSLLARTMETAEKEDRAITADEKAAIDTITADARKIQAQILRAEGQQSLSAQIEALTGGRGPAGPAGGDPALAFARVRKTLGQQFVESDAMEFFRKGGHRTSAAWRSPSVELFGTTLTEDAASGGKLVIPDYQAGILQTQTKRLVVADLFSPGTTDSNVVTYMKETTFTNAANSVAEGAAKPESALVFDQVSDPVRKIAHWLPVSEEMLEDVAQIRAYIDARLRLGVEIEEEDQLLNGTTTPPDIVGILNRSGLAASIAKGVAPDTNAEALFRQTMAIFQSSLFMPDGYVLNPANWTPIQLMKDSTGAYIGGGPFAAPPTPTLWGLPVAVTPSIVAGTGLVGAFKMGGQVFRKGGIRVEASNSHQDFFIKNLVAIRAEERLALAVYRPGAFGTVTALT